MLASVPPSPAPRPGGLARRGRWFAVAALGAAAALAAEIPAPGVAAPDGGGPVFLARLRSIIHPVAAEMILDGLEAAERADAAAFVLQLDTPGGLLTSTREIFQAMLESPVPVVVWVAPAGAQAASAGFFLLQAADVAAMAPGTNTGAAHPVGGAGETIEGVMGQKVEQDAAATIRSLASRAGRNVERAEEAVVESRSFTVDEAVRERLADVVAADLPSLLQAIEGRAVVKADGTRRVLRVVGRPIEEVGWRPLRRLLAAIAHPNVAYILLSLGFLGLYYEIATPGAILPGVLGGICLILAFFGLSVLPVNYAGVALIVLGLLFLAAETQVVSHGLLGTAGVASMVLGGFMLFRTAEPALRVSWQVLLGFGATAFAIVALGSTLVLRAHRRPVSTGREGLIGLRGEARAPLGPGRRGGKVFVHGELWNASAASEVEAGQAVEVVGIEGMQLRVRPAEAGPAR